MLFRSKKGSNTILLNFVSFHPILQLLIIILQAESQILPFSLTTICSFSQRRTDIILYNYYPGGGAEALTAFHTAFFCHFGVYPKVAELFLTLDT